LGWGWDECSFGLELLLRAKPWQDVGVMFAVDLEFEMAALVASILFGIGAAVWFWIELH